MNKKLSVLLVSIITLVISGCSTMHFHNGPERTKEKRSTLYSHWHHVGILELVEFSDPVSMRKKCKNKQWSSVTVEQGVPHSIFFWVVGVLYSPWDVKYSCVAK